MKLKPIKFLALATLAFTLGACSCNGNPETTTTNPETTTDTETTTTSNTETTETTSEEELSGDFQNWAEVVEETQEYFADPLPDFGDSRVTSLDYEYLGTATEAVEEDKVFLTNKENSNAVSYTFYYNADDAKDIVNGFNAKLVKLDYVKGTGNLKNIFTLTIGEKVVAEILIMNADDSSLTFYFLATAPGEVPPEPEETFATFVETLQATVTKEVREITGNNEYSYTLSFANLLDIESFVGFTLDSTSNGQYAENYEQDGLITKYNFSAIVKEGVYVLNTALSIYDGLEDAGFRSVSCAFFNNGGLFNSTTNEYVVLNYSSTAVEFTLHVFDSKSASLVN